MATNNKTYTNAYQKRHYAANREKYVLKAGKWKRKRFKLIQDLKKRPCGDCGIEYPPYVMQFDHKRDKLFSISTYASRYSLERVLAEIEKCDVVCANCHAIRTHKRRTSSKAE
jgi:hypothetical protein